MADPAVIGFPDAHRSELERAIEELIDRAQAVLRTQGRLRSLMRANSVVIEKLELREVLRRIAEAAVSLVDAQYGALGVIAPDGHLEQFIHVGMSVDDAEAIGHLPEGHGLLGAVVDSGQVIRLPNLADDSRSAGFPEHHPQMGSFLGVPIRVRDEVYGNLYLTNQADGAFSAEDEELVAALAATAGIAIENARLFEESERRQRWNAALTEVTAALLSGSEDVLAVIADRVGSAVDADLVCVIVPSAEDGMLQIQLARGLDAAGIEGRVYAAEGTIAGRALRANSIETTEADTVRSEDWQPDLGPTIALPLAAAGESLGVLTISRLAGALRFTAGDLEMASDFAAQAGVAIELGRAREDRQHLELSVERARIARDLHDHVIQRLFAAGLSLQSLADAAPAHAQQIGREVDAIDAAISDIRTAVFTLAHDRVTTTRHRVLDIATDFAQTLGFTPRVTFSGPVDLFVTGSIADDVAAVVREGLANIAKHAGAQSATVEIIADEAGVEILVEDDGVGIPEVLERASGTSNLAVRARERDREFSLRRRDTGGTTLEWRARLDVERGARS